MMAELYRRHMENLKERQRIAEMVFPDGDPGDDEQKRDEMEALLYGVAGLEETVLEPLAREIALRLGVEKYDVLGPFGLRGLYTINFYPSGKSDMFAERYSLRVTPVYDDGFHLDYDTARVAPRYPKGSLGDFHGFNVLTEKLPDDADEIIQRTLYYCKPRKRA